MSGALASPDLPNSVCRATYQDQQLLPILANRQEYVLEQTAINLPLLLTGVGELGAVEEVAAENWAMDATMLGEIGGGARTASVVAESGLSFGRSTAYAGAGLNLTGKIIPSTIEFNSTAFAGAGVDFAGNIVPSTSGLSSTAYAGAGNVAARGLPAISELSAAGQAAAAMARISGSGGEAIYRTMSESEYAGLTTNGGLSGRALGKSELGITLNPDYLSDIMSRPRVAKSYQVRVKFNVEPGTFDSLISQGATHPSACDLFPDVPQYTSGMKVPQIKLERNGVLSILLGNSESAIKFFNQSIISFEKF